MEKELIILAVYVNVQGQTQTSAQFTLQDIMRAYENMYVDTNKDVKVYWFPGDETKVECIYPPPNIISDPEILENELFKIYRLFLNSKDSEAKEMIKHLEKKLKLNSVIDKINKK